MKRALRITYAVIALVLFLSLVGLGLALLARPELADTYLRSVIAAIVGGAVVLLVFDLLGRYISRR